MTRAVALLALLVAIPACGPGPGTHAEVKFRDVTAPNASPSLFEMPLASIALVGEVDRDTVWTNADAAMPLDFTASVNAQVHSKRRNLALGDYTHVEIRLCDGDFATVRWQAPDLAAPRAFETACVKSEPLDDALAVSGGEQVTVKLRYDAAVARRELATGDDCVGDLDERMCFSVPAFVPSLDVEIVVE